MLKLLEFTVITEESILSSLVPTTLQFFIQKLNTLYAEENRFMR